MKVLVCGGREYNNKEKLYEILDNLHKENPITCLIHGCCRGADILGEQWAKEKYIEVVCKPPDWKKFGKGAALMRNAEMLKENPDCVIAFKGGNGTAHMVKISKANETKVIEVKDE